MRKCRRKGRGERSKEKEKEKEKEIGEDTLIWGMWHL